MERGFPQWFKGCQGWFVRGVLRAGAPASSSTCGPRCAFTVSSAPHYRQGCKRSPGGGARGGGGTIHAGTSTP